MTIGIGPIRIIAPPLTLFKLEAEPKVSSSIPTKIIAKAAKSSHVAHGTDEAAEYA